MAGVLDVVLTVLVVSGVVYPSVLVDYLAWNLFGVLFFQMMSVCRVWAYYGKCKISGGRCYC